MPGNADTDAAMQYLVWALEQIERTNNQVAAHHARIALDALREDMDIKPTGSLAPPSRALFRAAS